MISGNWKEDWPWYLFLLACLGGVLGAIMHYGFGVPENSPWLLIPLICVIPGFVALAIGGFILPIFGVMLGQLTRVLKKSGESSENAVITREIYKLKEKRNKIGHSRDQHYYFVHYVLRDLFFDMPLEIITLLKDKGRNDWLQDLWNQVGEEVGQSSSIASDVLCCEIRTLDNNTVVPIITLPTPQIPPEAYFVALVYRPSSSKQKGLTRFITLEDSLDLGDGSPANILCEWESNGSHANMGYGCEPTSEAFFEAVCRLLQSGSVVAKVQLNTSLKRFVVSCNHEINNEQ